MKNNLKTVNPDKNELGTKRICAKCGTKFYDFGKSDAACPSCKATADIVAGSPDAQVITGKSSRKHAPSPAEIEPSEDSSVNVDAEDVDYSNETDEEDAPEGDQEEE